MKWIRTHKAATVIIVLIVALLFVIAGSFAGFNFCFNIFM